MKSKRTELIHSAGETARAGACHARPTGTETGPFAKTGRLFTVALALTILCALRVDLALGADSRPEAIPSPATEEQVQPDQATSAPASDKEKIDPSRARALFRKQNGGQNLSPEDQAYLDRAMGGPSSRGKAAPAPEQGKSPPTFKPIVSKEACPIVDLSVSAKDGEKPLALMRKPPGAGPFPVVVYFHGGSAAFSHAQLEAELQGQTLSRFLASGYVVVAGTYRPVRQIDDSIVDGVAIVEHVKTIPGVDPKSVVIWGDSGGGSLGFDIAARIPVRALAVMEPATILFARVGSGEDRLASITNPKSVYTAAAQDYTRKKIRRIDCPIFLAHGDIHPINNFNNQITIPEMRAEKRNLEVKLYPGENHGFSRRSVATLDGPKRFFDDCDAFFKRHLATQPTPLPEGLISEVAVEFDKGRSADREEK